jgi:hypothetical protein
MIKHSKETLLHRVGIFSDSKIIARELARIAEDMGDEDEHDYPYWLKEAEVHILGLHNLVLELSKILKQEEAEKYYAVREQTQTV